MTTEDTTVQATVDDRNVEFGAELTRKERELLNGISLEVYGKKAAWQKMLRRGEYRAATDFTKNGQSILVQRLHHFTLTEIYNGMLKIIQERVDAAKKPETAAE